MPIELKLPELGEGVTSGDVLEVLVAVGDSIKKDQGIVELETEKATVSIPASQAGVVAKILVSAGQTVNVGQPLIAIEPADASAAKPSEKAPEKPVATADQTSKPKAAPAADKTEAKKPPAPEPAETEAEADAETPPEDEPEEEIEKPQSKPAPAKKSEPAPVAPAAKKQVEEEATATDADAPRDMGSVAAGPSIRRFAREVGVDLRRVAGSGPGGRITRDDVLHVVRNGSAGQRAVPTAASGQRDSHGPVHFEKLSRIRRTIAEKMHISWTTVPKVTNFDDADITDLEEFRNESKDDYSKQGIKLTSMPFVIKAVAMALKTHPLINASIDLEAGQIIFKDYINIGIAVDTERGLIVPSLREVDKLSIPQIARQLQSLSEAARNSTFTLDDLKGSTFTISNLGAIGGSYSTPIINVPESAILLTGRARKMPVVVEAKVAVRLMMPLSISYDHRLIDGSTAARFLNDVIAYLQAPSRLLLAP